MDPRWFPSACVAGVLSLAPYAVACARDVESAGVSLEASVDDASED